MQITDTAAIVTGGASGLGAATAAALAAGGARVFAVDGDQRRLAQVDPRGGRRRIDLQRHRRGFIELGRFRDLDEAIDAAEAGSTKMPSSLER